MAFGVEDRRELILDDGHIPLVLHQLRKDVLGDAARPLLLEAIAGPAGETSGSLMLATSSSAPIAKYHSSSVFIRLNSAMDSR